MKKMGLICCSTLLSILFVAPSARAGMGGASGGQADCGYDFYPHELAQLRRFGWHCDKDDTAVAKHMKQRGFIQSQYVDAYRAARDIPRIGPLDIETIAVLQLVDIPPKYYFMIDEQYRPSLTTYYNKKLFRRGRILTAVGYSTAVVGIALSVVGGLMIGHADDPALQMNPGGTAVTGVGIVSLFTGMAMGSIGVHKLRLISHDEILDTGSMETLRKRRTKTHHFAPDDLFEYQMGAPNVPQKSHSASLSPVISPEFVGIAGVITF